MELEDILKFQLKRVNPFPGLVIDADTWRDAHSYHRDQLRLHLLAFHMVGIVGGLAVTANDPPDLSVTIQQGVAIDPEGNVIIVPQAQRYQLQTHQKGIVYLVIQFREIPAAPYQPPEGGQPTRITEAYRIQERDKLPDEPYLELARIDFDPAGETIRDAKAGPKPGKNEIDLTFRREARPVVEVAAAAAAPVAEQKEPVMLEASPPGEKVTIGHAVLGEASKELQVAGWQNLIKEMNRQNRFVVDLEQNIPLIGDMGRYTMVYLTGNSRFELNAEQQTALGDSLESGGVIFGEGFSGSEEEESKGAREFGLAFNRLATQLKCKLETVQRGHPLLSVVHLFSEVPPGAAPGMLLEGGHMVYSGSDYAMGWQGGHQNHPLSRDIIRNVFEMGTNIVAFARIVKTGHR